MVRFASEDIGLADPHALVLAVAAQQAFHLIGRPEGDLALAEAAVYLATAPKSNALYKAYTKARQKAGERGGLPVPMELRNAPTALMRRMGYGRNYRYPHDLPDGYLPMSYLPEDLQSTQFYQPTNRGHEASVAERLRYWRQRVHEERQRTDNRRQKTDDRRQRAAKRSGDVGKRRHDEKA